MDRKKLTDTAYRWACDYIDAQQDIDFQGVFEGMTDEQWADHLDFIVDCFEVGLKPTHFLDTLIESQRDFNLLYGEGGSE